MPAGEMRTYGNWRKPISPGVAGLGLVGTLLLVVGVIATLLALTISWALSFIVAFMFALVIIPLLITDRFGRNGMQRITARIVWLNGRLQGAHLYRSGALGRLPVRSCEPPGLLAGTTIIETVDAHGQPFAVLHAPAMGHFSVVLACDAEGASLMDQDGVDTWVAHWGHWLATLGHEPSIIGASATVESAPDTGERLRREVAGRVKPDAPALARDVIEEILMTYPEGSAQLSSYVTITYARTLTARSHSEDDFVTEIATRLPGLAGALAMTGAGPARALTGSELAGLVRSAFDPASTEFVEEAQAGGGEVLNWDEAGPIAAEETWDSYRHDSGSSITWIMTDAPRGHVFSSVLGRLVGPHPDIARKRVTLVYRPYNPGDAAKTVDRDIRDAVFRVHQSKVPKARDDVRIQAVEQAAREEATGAGLVRFGILVTATVAEHEDLTLAAAAVENLAASARIQVRRATGAQSAAFAAALPLGLVLPLHLRVPERVREAM